MASSHGLVRCFVCAGPAPFAAVTLVPAFDGLAELRAIPFCAAHELDGYERAMEISCGCSGEPMKVTTEDLDEALRMAAEYLGLPALVLTTVG